MRQKLPFTNQFLFEGATLNYKKIGTGSPVVLLHGSLTSYPWAGFEEKLAASYTVFLPELPGFGASETIPQKRHTIELFSRAFSAFLSQFHLEQTPIVALSLGTIVTLHVAANKKSRGKLILVGIPGKLSGWKFTISNRLPLPLKRFLVSTTLGKKKLLLPLLTENLNRRAMPGENEKLLSVLSCADPKALVDVEVKKEIEEALPRFLEKIENPVTYIYGEYDKLKDTTAALIPYPLIVPDAGHNIFDTNQDAALKLILNILS